jgi:hypothetical protein
VTLSAGLHGTPIHPRLTRVLADSDELDDEGVGLGDLAGGSTVMNLTSVEDRAALRRSTTPGRIGPISARLKALPCDVECVAQLAWSFISNAFKLHAAMEFIRTVALRHPPGNVQQRRCTGRINLCPEMPPASLQVPGTHGHLHMWVAAAGMLIMAAGTQAKTRIG